MRAVTAISTINKIHKELDGKGYIFEKILMERINLYIYHLQFSLLTLHFTY